jgi:hypothetical protein
MWLANAVLLTVALVGCTHEQGASTEGTAPRSTSNTPTTTSVSSTVAVGSPGDPYAIFCDHWGTYYHAAHAPVGQTDREAIARLRQARNEAALPMKPDVLSLWRLVTHHTDPAMIRILEKQINEGCASVGFPIGS